MSEIGRRVGVTAERTKDRERRGHNRWRSGEKKNPTVKSFPPFLI